MTGEHKRKQSKTDEYRQAQPTVTTFTHTIARNGLHGADCIANYT